MSQETAVDSQIGNADSLFSTDLGLPCRLALFDGLIGFICFLDFIL